MLKATPEFIKETDALFQKRKAEVLSTKDCLDIKGTTYYVSTSGDDNNDGKSPETAWKTLQKATATPLQPGDGVLFKRGDLFRGSLFTQPGVTYGAYGSGDKPKIYSHDKSVADPSLWEEFDKELHIWKYKEPILDVGTIVFDGGKAHCRKLIPTYRNDRFVCRDNEEKLFDLRNEMTQNLDIFWEYADNFSLAPSKGENFAIPTLNGNSLGTLYIRCDEGNPGAVYKEAEALVRVHAIGIGRNENVTIDNLCVKYIGMHGISSGPVCNGLTVTNCEFGWIGGTILHYSGEDPNFPPGKRGTVTRFGNAIEVYGACRDYTVRNNYIYEVYDAGITHQVTTKDKKELKNIEYADNVIENCVYGIEYFLDQIEGERESCMENVNMTRNFIRLTGYGWGQQRHNVDTPSHIKGWDHVVNTAKDYRVTDNIFDRSAYRMLQFVGLKDEFLPFVDNNIYIQHLGATMGQYGNNENGAPKDIMYDEKIEESINNIFGDKNAKVYYM